MEELMHTMWHQQNIKHVNMSMRSNLTQQDQFQGKHWKTYCACVHMILWLLALNLDNDQYIPDTCSTTPSELVEKNISQRSRQVSIDIDASKCQCMNCCFVLTCLALLASMGFLSYFCISTAIQCLFKMLFWHDYVKHAHCRNGILSRLCLSSDPQDRVAALTSVSDWSWWRWDFLQKVSYFAFSRSYGQERRICRRQTKSPPKNNPWTPWSQERSQSFWVLCFG